MKGDECILGCGDFVETVLKSAKENLDRKSRIRALGYDFDWLVDRVLDIFGPSIKELLTGGKQRKTVQARGVLCYWAMGELGDERSGDFNKTENRLRDGKRIRGAGTANR